MYKKKKQQNIQEQIEEKSDVDNSVLIEDILDENGEIKTESIDDDD